MSNRQIFLSHIGQTSSSPMMLEIASANGLILHGVNGKKYIDLISGVNVSALGHSHPRIIKAVKDQVDRHMHLMVYGEFIQSPQIEYADLLTRSLPPTLNSVFFVNSGTEAVEGALKLAKRLTARTEMISFNNAYHGSTHGAMSVMGGEYFKNAFRPLLPDVTFLNFNCRAELELISDKTACVIVEPIQAEAGIILPSPGYLEALRSKCTETGSILIFDEIQTGFGRLGTLFGFELNAVVPDILVLAKSFGGGMPLGAFISSHGNMKVLTENPVLGHITTFGGHPVSCAAGLETLKILLEGELVSNVEKKGLLFRKLLKHKLIKEIRGKGLMLAVELGDEKLMLELVNAGVEKGFITDWFLFCSTAFRISPPLTISEEQIKNACALIIEALDEMSI